MQSFLLEYYFWIKSLHLIAVISWMAGLFYLPRLFVYHCGAEVGSELDRTFQIMERKLLRIIMNPAMIAAWVVGGALMLTPGVIEDGSIWFYGKLIGVLLMTGFHMMLARWRKDFAAGENGHSEKFYRQANEVPTVLMIIIVVLAVVKPL